METTKQLLSQRISFLAVDILAEKASIPPIGVCMQLLFWKIRLKGRIQGGVCIGKRNTKIDGILDR